MPRVHSIARITDIQETRGLKVLENPEYSEKHINPRYPSDPRNPRDIRIPRTPGISKIPDLYPEDIEVLPGIHSITWIEDHEVPTLRDNIKKL
jgi:hypothetical protein